MNDYGQDQTVGERRRRIKYYTEKAVDYACTITPKSAYFLLCNCMLESFYKEGMRSVIVIYVKEELGIVASDTKYLYHLARFSNIGSTVIGSILTDMYIGKFLIIVLMDFLAMAIGLTLAVSTYTPFGFTKKWKINIAIFCVVLSELVGLMESSRMAFPGDQYEKIQTKARDEFYYALYFMYSVGSTSATLVVPRLRADVKCMDTSENCFLVAFGVPVCVSAVATVVLFAGYPFYKFLPPSKTTNWNLIKCFGYAFYRRLSFCSFRIFTLKRSSKYNRDHWVDLADDKYDAHAIADVKAVSQLILLYTAFPMFWALFDQQSTLWTLMSSKMDGRTVFGQILADQMDFLSPLLLMIGVLLFTFILYPLFEKCHFMRKPLERIGYGFILGALSFIYGGCINIAIENEMPAYPGPGVTDVVLHNGLPCNILVHLGHKKIKIEKYKSVQHSAFIDLSSPLSGNLTIAEKNCDLDHVPDLNFNLLAKEKSAYSVVFAMDKEHKKIVYQQALQKRLRDNRKNAPQIRFMYIGKSKGQREIALKSSAIVICARLMEVLTNEAKAYRRGNSINDETEICYFYSNNKKMIPDENEDEDTMPGCRCDISIQKYTFLRGGIYDVLIIEKDDKTTTASVFVTAKPDSIPILLQLPMYGMMSTGSVLCLITAYSFAYSESPESTKCFLQAIIYVSTSLGNLIVFTTDMILNSIGSSMNGDDMPESAVFFVYAALMVLDTFYFMYLAKRYTYINPVYQSIK